MFVNKPTLLVINKIDIKKPEDLNASDYKLLQDIIQQDQVPMVQLSCFTEEGVMDVKNQVKFKLAVQNIN